MNKTTNSDENNHQSNDTSNTSDISEKKSLTADNKAQHAQSQMPADKTKKSKQRSFSLALPFSIFSMIVTILAIIVFSFAIIHLQNLKSEVNSLQLTLEKNQQQISLQSTALTDTQQKVDTVTSHQDQQKNQLEQNRQQLTTLRNMMPDVKEDLGLNDIEQLLSIANIKLYWQKDIATSIVLLETADQQIAKLDDPNLLPIRQEIARKRNDLQAIPKVDVNGLLSELNAVSEQIPKLAMISNQLPTKKQAPSPSVAPSNDTPQSTWKDTLTMSWEALQKIIIIRHHDLATQPLLPPEQSAYLIENIQLSLMKAQWAILQSDQAVYDTSLKQAIDWIGTYLNNNDHAEQMINSLKELRTVTLNPELPNLNHLLVLVESSIQARDPTADRQDTSNEN